jgi:hypothetical protein
MTQTVYLHIGHGRCGSSSIQVFARNNREALAKRGILYPSGVDIGFQEPLALRGGNAQVIYQSDQDAEAKREMVGRYLDAREDERILFSSEYLIGGRPDFLRPFVEVLRSGGRQLKVVAYVREQREWMISRYAQAIKSKRWTMPLEQYMLDGYTAPGLDYLSTFNTWAELAGREQLTIRIFERDRLEGGDARTDLMKLTGVEADDLISDDPTANASVSVEELEVARLASAATDPPNFNPRGFFRHTREMMDEKGWAPTTELYRLVSPETMRKVGEYFKPKNEQFRRAFFPDQPEPLFNTKIPEQYEPLSRDQRVSERSVAMLSAYFARGQDRVRERRALRESRQPLRRELRRAQQREAKQARRRAQKRGD